MLSRCGSVFAAFLLASAGASGVLEVGVSSCEITPDVTLYEVPMAGYGARQAKPSTGVHDALRAKVLYLRDGEISMALITMDLRSTTPKLKNQILEKASDLGLGRENLMVAASHNHSGPSFYAQEFWQLQFGTYDPAILDIMTTMIAQALREAVANAEPALVGFGEVDLAAFTKNRRWGYDTEAREAAGEVAALSSRLWVMRVDTAGGALKALLVSYATHPTILGADNFLLSAEWPGILQRDLEKAFPGSVSLFTNGAEGDQAPSGAQGSDAFDRMSDFGGRLAAQAASLARRTPTSPATIAYAYSEPSLGEPVFSKAAKEGRYAFMEPLALEALPRRAELQQFRIGDAVLVALPGEPIQEVGAATERGVAALGAKYAITVGLANDYVGYILNEKEYGHGGYEVDSRSFYGPGLGDFIARETAKSAAGLFEPANGEQ